MWTDEQVGSSGGGKLEIELGGVSITKSRVQVYRNQQRYDVLNGDWHGDWSQLHSEGSVTKEAEGHVVVLGLGVLVHFALR